MKQKVIACVLALTMALGMSTLVACGGGNSGGGNSGGGAAASDPAKDIVGSWVIDRVEVAGQKVDAAQMGITDDMYKFTFKDDGTAEFSAGGQSATAKYELASDGKIVLEGDAAASADLGLMFSDGVVTIDVESAKIIFKKA